MKRWTLLLLAGLLGQLLFADAGRPNILLLTADDMSFDSVGFNGCPLPGISPNLDRLAKEGLQFEYAHIMTPICGPSRGAIFSGRYPHRSGQMGHGKQPVSWWQPKGKVPTLAEYLHAAGYRTGIICKGAGGIEHTFDLNLGKAETDVGRNPARFGTICREFFAEAKKNGQPFFMNANFCDPHAPWARVEGDGWIENQRKSAKAKGFDFNIPEPKTHYKPEEIPVPPFLMDTPEVRADIAPYFDSVNRMDEGVGAVLQSLEDSGMAANTIVVFLSDHGIGCAFGKRSNYLYGTRTPLVFKWPGRIKPGIDRTHMVSSIDLMPSLIEAAGLPPVDGLDGRSLAPMLFGQKPVQWREYVYSAFNCMNGEEQYWPSRSIVGKRFLYVWNGWADGKQLADEVLHSHCELKEEHRNKRWGEDSEFGPVEEFYDIASDPGYWNNLVGNPEFAGELEKMRNAMANVMRNSDDQEYANFKNKGSGQPRIVYKPDPLMVKLKELKSAENKIKKSQEGSKKQQEFMAGRDRLKVEIKQLESGAVSATDLQQHADIEAEIKRLIKKKHEFEKNSEGWNKYKAEIKILKQQIK